MKRSGAQPLDIAILTAAAVGVPIALLGILYLGRVQLPSEALIVLLGVYVAGLTWMALHLSLFSQEAQRRPAPAPQRMRQAMAALAESLGLELVYGVPPPPSALSIAVVDSVGRCPLGLKVGDTLQVDAEGRLSSALCSSAVAALFPEMASPSGTPGADDRATCRCPLMAGGITFLVQPAAAPSAA